MKLNARFQLPMSYYQDLQRVREWDLKQVFSCCLGISELSDMLRSSSMLRSIVREVAPFCYIGRKGDYQSIYG